jgi:hypothetical protein
VSDEKKDNEVDAQVNDLSNVVEELDDNELGGVAGGLTTNNCINAVAGCGCG